MCIANNLYLSIPQVMPASDLKILLRLCIFEIVAAVNGVNEHRLPSVTSKMFEFLNCWNFKTYFFVQFINMVAVDLVGESIRLLTERKRKRSVR